MKTERFLIPEKRKIILHDLNRMKAPGVPLNPEGKEIFAHYSPFLPTEKHAQLHKSMFNSPFSVLSQEFSWMAEIS